MAYMDEKDTPEKIYVIGQSPNGIVKIGRSVDVPRRLQAIQSMSPIQVQLLYEAPGDRHLEAWLHKSFADRHSHGEWFDFAGHDAVALVVEAADQAPEFDRNRRPTRRRERGEGSVFRRKDGYWVAAWPAGRCHGGHRRKDGTICRGGERLRTVVVRRTKKEAMKRMVEMQRERLDAR